MDIQRNDGNKKNKYPESIGTGMPNNSINEETEFSAELTGSNQGWNQIRSGRNIQAGSANQDGNPGMADSTGTARGTGLNTYSVMGWFAAILAAASLFVFPGVLGSAAVVFGAIAFMNRSRTLGAWSVIIGLISLITYWILLPYFP